eukprot:2428970-Prymnesium_polylepis.1
MPRFVISSIGMLFVPAPQRAIARTELATSSVFSLCERSRTACGSSPVPSGTLPDEPVSMKLPDGNLLRPDGLIALNVCTWNLGPPPSSAAAAALA